MSLSDTSTFNMISARARAARNSRSACAYYLAAFGSETDGVRRARILNEALVAARRCLALDNSSAVAQQLIKNYAALSPIEQLATLIEETP